MAKKNGRAARGQRRADKVQSRRRRLAQDEVRRESHARTVVERAGDPAYVQRVRDPDGSSTVSWDPATPMGRSIQGSLEGQLEAFRRKFGREPGPQDPVFFDPDADEPAPISDERITAMLDDMVGRMEAAGEDAAVVKAWRDLGYFVTEENVHTFSAAEVEAWEDAVADYEIDDLDLDELEVDDFVGVMESMLREAVRASVEQRSAVPARDVSRLIVSTDAMVDEDDEPEENGWAFGLSTAFAVLAGWITGVRERDPDVPMADDAVAWVRAEIGEGPAEAVARAAPLLGAVSNGETGDLTVPQLVDELQDDFLPALIWLASGAVVRFGGGDTEWLPAIGPESEDEL